MRTLKLLVIVLFLLPGLSAVADQGMTSPVHRDNVGKIVFSSQEVKFKKEDPALFKSTFRLGEPIYGRMYFPQAMYTTPVYHTQTGEPPSGSARDGAWKMEVFVDGENKNMSFGSFAQGKVKEKVERNWTTWQLNLNPDQEKFVDKTITEPWVELVAGLGPGEHDVRVVFKTMLGQFESKPMAEGSFKLVIREGDTFTAGSFPESTYTGSDLSALKQAMRKALVGPVAKSPAEIVDIAVTSDWLQGRFTDTLQEYRKIQGTVLWADENGDGIFKYTTYSFIQTRQGNGWSQLRFRGFMNGGLEGSLKR